MFSNRDSVYILTYSIMMLNTDQHSSQVCTSKAYPFASFSCFTEEGLKPRIGLTCHFCVEFAKLDFSNALLATNISTPLAACERFSTKKGCSSVVNILISVVLVRSLHSVLVELQYAKSVSVIVIVLVSELNCFSAY